MTETTADFAKPRKGQCLCGAVQVSATLRGPCITACHCTQCQRWTGGGPSLAVQVENLDVIGDEHMTPYFHSSWGERACCKICGANIYWKMQDKSAAYISVGLLEDQSGLKIAEEIFIDFRPDWLDAVAGATQSTQAQEMKKLEAYLAQQSPKQ